MWVKKVTRDNLEDVRGDRKQISTEFGNSARAGAVQEALRKTDRMESF